MIYIKDRREKIQYKSDIGRNHSDVLDISEPLKDEIYDLIFDESMKIWKYICKIYNIKTIF